MPLTLFRAEAQPEGYENDQDLGWSKYTAGGLEIIAVPGNHRTMMEAPHVQVLGERLKACLQGAGLVAESG